MTNTDLKDILLKLSNGEISIDQAEAEINRNPEVTKTKLKRGRPKKTKLSLPKRKQGRRKDDKRAEKMVFIATIWVLLSDRIPKMKLRGILADALKVEDSYVSKAIARLNALVKSPILST